MTRFRPARCALFLLLLCGGICTNGVLAGDDVHCHHRKNCDGPCCRPLPPLPALPQPTLGTAQLTVRVPAEHRLHGIEILDNTLGETVTERVFGHTAPTPLVFQQALHRRATPHTYTVQVRSIRQGTIHYAQRPVTLAVGRATSLSFLPSHFTPIAAVATAKKPASKKRARRRGTAKKRGTTSRVGNAIVLYEFEEGKDMVVHDVSNAGNPVHLDITSRAFHWLSPRGLRIDAASRVESPDPATKVVAAAKQTNELTVEAWVQARDRFQGKVPPARIVTLSHGPSNRNFTLGQDGDRYVVRLRSDPADPNGTAHVLRSGSYSVQPSRPAHVVLTFAGGWATLYVNGQEVAKQKTGGNLAGFSEYRLALGNELQGSRAWLGTYYLVAIYNRAMKPEKVVQNFEAGY